MVGVLNPKRIEQARLESNLSHGDLAYEIRRLSGGRLKANESQVRKWIKGLHRPADGVIVVIANATGKTVEFFYGEDDEEESRAVRMSRIRAALAASGNGDLVADLEALTGADR